MNLASYLQATVNLLTQDGKNAYRIGMCNM